MTKSDYHRYPFYSPRFWHGMRPAAWLGLLRSGGFRVHPTRIPLATGVTVATGVNLVLGTLQQMLYGRRLQAAQLAGPPIFVIGHWRSGTTMLHELMVLDQRLSSPSTLQCFAPHHFLISEWFFRNFAPWLLPKKRPMDNMEAGWDRPQEDEFALLALGLRSPYRRMAFPNQPPPDVAYLDFEDVESVEVERWLKRLRQFLTTVTLATERRLVVKSPTHTGRIAWLGREFPDATFIHLTRHPYDLFPSTCRLWRSLDEAQALQWPRHRQLEPYVVQCLQSMYRGFDAGRPSLAAERIVDVRYEDLVADPLGILSEIYQRLRLPDFTVAEPAVRQWVESHHRQYQTNRHQLDADTARMLRSAWRDYFQRYGYE